MATVKKTTIESVFVCVIDNSIIKQSNQEVADHISVNPTHTKWIQSNCTTFEINV